jgi:hypothetical protein
MMRSPTGSVKHPVPSRSTVGPSVNATISASCAEAAPDAIRIVHAGQSVDTSSRHSDASLLMQVPGVEMIARSIAATLIVHASPSPVSLPTAVKITGAPAARNTASSF